MSATAPSDPTAVDVSPADLPRAFDNRVSRDLGVPIPIVQAPMGWIARAQLASAVSRCGACGIIETSSGELEMVKGEIRKMRDLTDRPFGVNIAQAFVRDPSIAEFVIEQGVKFVTTSAGSPTKYTSILKAAGLTVYHVVPTLAAALKAVDAGVDGLVVEGGEGGGFKSPTPVSTMVLLPLVRSKVDVPIIAAGGITDGATMAAAFALGAEGVQMGTRMVSAAESPVHDNWKQAIIDAAETDTLFLNDRHSPALRALRTDRTEALQHAERNVFGDFGDAQALYFGGDMNAAIALVRPGRRPHRLGPSGRRHHQRHRHRVRRHHRASHRLKLLGSGTRRFTIDRETPGVRHQAFHHPDRAIGGAVASCQGWPGVGSGAGSTATTQRASGVGENVWGEIGLTVPSTTISSAV